MKFQPRAIRIAVALTLASIIANQIPMRGDVALGSIQQPKDSYLNPGSDNSGSFLGIRGFSNRNAITGIGIALFGLGAYSTLTDSHRSKVVEVSPSGNTQSGNHSEDSTTQSSLYDTASKLPNDFSEIIHLIDDAGLTDLLKSSGPFTFLAPTNEALSPRNGSSVYDKKDKKSITLFVKNHIIKGKYSVNDLMSLKTGDILYNISNERLIVKVKENVLSINNAIIIQNDIISNNGYIHPLSTGQKL